MVREVRSGRRARRAIARRVVRGGGFGLLSKREQHAYRIVGERAGGLGDEKGAGYAASESVSVVVGRCRSYPSVALARAGALQPTPRTVTMRASSVLPNAKSLPSAVEAAPPRFYASRGRGQRRCGTASSISTRSSRGSPRGG